jgi:hypothetical protein
MGGALGIKKNNPGCDCCPDPDPQPDCTLNFFQPRYYQMDWSYGLQAVLDLNVAAFCNCNSGPLAWFVAPDPAIIPNPLVTPAPSYTGPVENYDTGYQSFCVITDGLCLARPVIAASPQCIALSSTWKIRTFISYHSVAIRISNDPGSGDPRYTLSVISDSVTVCIDIGTGDICGSGGSGVPPVVCATGGLGSVTASGNGTTNHFNVSLADGWWEAIGDDNLLLGWPVVNYHNRIPDKC